MSRDLIPLVAAAVALIGGGCGLEAGRVEAEQQAEPDAREPAWDDDAAVPEREPYPCLGEPGPGHRVVDCEGLVFDVEVPAACVQAPCGLIVDVHGGTMSAQMQDANTGMRMLGRQNGFVVVQPNAKPDPPLASYELEDDARVLAFVERMIAAWPIDRRRVHLTGFSQGGYMSWRFVCMHPEVEVFASIAPAAAAWGRDCVDNPLIVATGCLLDAASREIDILYMHGVDDGLVPISCSGEQRQSLFEAFDMHGDPTPIAGDDSYTWVQYRNDRGTVFEYIEHRYSAPNLILRGHCYPGSRDSGAAPGQLFSFACEGTQALWWGEAAVRFFLEHPAE